MLLPLGLFSTPAAPAKLTLADVRLVLNQQDFASYLDFFSKQLDASKLTPGGGSIMLHTVSLSVVLAMAETLLTHQGCCLLTVCRPDRCQQCLSNQLVWRPTQPELDAQQVPCQTIHILPVCSCLKLL